MMDAGSSPMPDSIQGTSLTLAKRSEHLSMHQTMPISTQFNGEWNQNNGNVEKRHSLLNVDIVQDSFERNSEYCDTEEINKSIATPPRKLKNGDKGNTKKLDTKNQYGLQLEPVKEKIPLANQFSSFSAGTD